MKVKSESEVAQLCPTLATPWTAACQAPPSMGFSRQEYWSGVPLPSLPDLWDKFFSRIVCCTFPSLLLTLENNVTEGRWSLVVESNSLSLPDQIGNLFGSVVPFASLKQHLPHGIVHIIAHLLPNKARKGMATHLPGKSHGQSSLVGHSSCNPKCWT